MPDYGHEIEFAYFLIPDAGDSEGVLEIARLADHLGYDLLAVQDHPYQRRHLDTLALLGVILGQTERIRVFQDVGRALFDLALASRAKRERPGPVREVPLFVQSGSDPPIASRSLSRSA